MQELLERPLLIGLGQPYGTESAPNPDNCDGDWEDAYAVLTTPAQVVIEGTTRHLRIMRCAEGHLHLNDKILWAGPLSNIGFCEVWERANGGGELIVRVPSPVREIGDGDGIQLGPGIIGHAQ